MLRQLEERRVSALEIANSDMRMFCWRLDKKFGIAGAQR
jgi:hypothetical protein